VLPSNEFMDLVDRILAVRSLTDAQATLDVIRSSLGLERFLYGVTRATRMEAGANLVICNYQSPWMQRYVEQDYFSIDPVVSHCFSSSLPYTWDRLHQDACEQPVRRFISEAQDFGLKNGVSVGLRGRRGQDALLSVATSVDTNSARSDLKRAVPMVYTILPYVYEALHPLASNDHGGNPSLSNRELECLLWSAEGLTAQEISDRICISTPTVNFHLKNAAGKLGVRNRTQAVARAILLGVIAPATVRTPRYTVLHV